MTDLTEQWKDGTLKAGAYYILSATGGIFPDSYNPYGYFEQFDSLVKEVLEPVPSYDDWKATIGTAQFLIDKNAQLKNLLKECREALNMVEGETVDFAFTVDRCIEKINQALGGDK